MSEIVDMQTSLTPLCSWVFPFLSTFTTRTQEWVCISNWELRWIHFCSPTLYRLQQIAFLVIQCCRVNSFEGIINGINIKWKNLNFSFGRWVAFCGPRNTESWYQAMDSPKINSPFGNIPRWHEWQNWLVTLHAFFRWPCHPMASMLRRLLQTKLCESGSALPHSRKLRNPRDRVRRSAQLT